MPDVCATCSSWNPNGESEFGACVNQNSPRFGQFTHGTRTTCDLFGRLPMALSGVRAFLVDLLENPPPPPAPEPQPIPEPDPEPVVEPDPEPTPEEPPAPVPQPELPPEEAPPADPVEPPVDEPVAPEIPNNG